MQWAEGGRSVPISFSHNLSVFDRLFCSLDDFIEARLGRKPANIHLRPLDSAPNSAPVSSKASTTPARLDSPTLAAQSRMSDTEVPTQQTEQAHFTNANDIQKDAPYTTQDPLSRSARIRAFRAYQFASPEEKERLRGNWGADGLPGTDGDNSGARRRGEWTAVHLLSANEVKSLFKDVVDGLRFLVLNFILFSSHVPLTFAFVQHSKSILHLDLKPGNVLLTWDEGKLMYVMSLSFICRLNLIRSRRFSPRAMLSDFGTSRDMLKRSRVQRSGNTGT